MKKIIVNFEVYEHGHQIGYLAIIFSFIIREKRQNDYVFLLNTEAKKILKDQIELFPKHAFIFPTDFEQNEIDSEANLFLKKNKEWKLIQNYSNLFHCKEILLMNLDQYMPSIILMGCSKKLSGIYFRPSFRIYKENTSLKTKALFYVKKSKKVILEFFVFKIYKKRIKGIFLLNDYKSVSYFNKTFGNHFYYLEDPIFEHELEKKDIEDTIMDQSKIVFLLFGAISPRKNIENVLTAYELLPIEFRHKVVLLIAGSIKKDYKERFYKFLNSITKRNKDLNIIVDERFLSDEDMHLYFKKSDLILIPYKDLYTSSGVLGIAAFHDKPCMVSEIGLLSELVDEYNLGIKVNPFSTLSISKGMITFLNSPLFTISGSRFCNLHRPERFIKTLFRN